MKRFDSKTIVFPPFSVLLHTQYLFFNGMLWNAILNDKPESDWKLTIKLTNFFCYFLTLSCYCAICHYAIWNSYHYLMFFGPLLQLISATDRHRPSTDHPIKFILRRPPCSLKFKIKLGICLYLLASSKNKTKWSQWWLNYMTFNSHVVSSNISFCLCY